PARAAKARRRGDYPAAHGAYSPDDGSGGAPRRGGQALSAAPRPPPRRPPGEGVEPFMRFAVPRGAAVTVAILGVNGRPMNGAFVERDRARAIYRSIVERRRDPALVTWDGPGGVAVSIFPLERGEPRRFELEWVEPAAIAGG